MATLIPKAQLDSTLVDTSTSQALTNKTYNGLNIGTSAGTLTIPASSTITRVGAHTLSLTTTATTAATIPSGTVTLLVAGTAQTVTGAKTFNSSNLILAGSTSGTTTVNSGAVAGTSVITMPVATDTLVGKATTDTLTNKTFDTAGTGNSFSINGVAATANTGTGAIVRAVSPALTTPTGIVKSDVGLGNVDNTSNATERAAVATLTNKDLTSATNTFPVRTTTRLNAIESTDFANPVALTANTWADIKANQNFTVGNANSTILISVCGQAIVGNASAVTAVRVVIDSAGTPINRNIAGNQVPSGQYVNILAGTSTISITGLSAGVHTIKTQAMSNVGNNVYCRTLSSTFEFFTTTVVESL